MPILVSGVELGTGAHEAQVGAHLGLDPAEVLTAQLVRKSLDARQRRKRWVANYKVEVRDEPALLARGLRGVRAWSERDELRFGLLDLADIPRSTWPAGVRPIVVGAGPAGLFAALRLAEAGAPVVLLERGEPVEDRVKTVNATWRGAALDPESNVVFGEGGAGTFSDGKIYTRKRDGDLGYVFSRLVQMGADPEIRREAWAHLGTDRVRALLPRFRERIRSLGGEVRFGAAVSEFLTENGSCVGVRLAGNEELRGAPVLVATGHSARDVYSALVDAGAEAVARPISIGARIEHPQTVIDHGRYGHERGDLPPASYRLTWTPDKGRRAHTFCMCPGGMVVPATNHPEHVVVNGMSFSARRAFWANSAIIVHVDPTEFPGRDPLAGLRYQASIERKAFALGGDYRAPAQRVQDLLARRASADVPRTSYPQGVIPADLRDVLPEGIIGGLVRAIRQFDRELPGFAGPEAVLIAPETRTTAPLRFLRGRERHSTTLSGLLPVGEGAGYAGGIVSAALDGVRAAESVVESHAPRRTSPISGTSP
ncbi:MAG: FAD-binding protein [Proteobacteria bacterium]|nr:FAD-binding protein [Pseudomonadota bacterium]MCP4918212.1 FAD-binding protein [Pseudomonadota bacterium]